jgi:hypothetical protein
MLHTSAMAEEGREHALLGAVVAHSWQQSCLQVHIDGSQLLQPLDKQAGYHKPSPADTHAYLMNAFVTNG